MADASRFNTVHVPAGSSSGGQFGTAGSGKTHPGTGHGAHPKHTVPGGPTHTLAYNPKTNTGPGYDLKNGDPNVKQLQAALNNLGLTDGKGHQLAVDGKLGPLTTQSIQAAQTRLGLKATGHVSPALFARLVAMKTLPHRSADLDNGGAWAMNTRDIHADTLHNHQDITFLHNLTATLEGSTSHARAVITDGVHPDVRAVARDVLTSHTDQLATMGRLQKQLGIAATSSSTSSSSSSGHGNSGGGNAYGHNSADPGGEFRSAMSTQSINDLPDSDFAYIEPGGTKDSSGKTTPRSLRHFPIHDAAHVRNALSRAPQSPFGEKAMPKIRAAAKRFGITVGDSQSNSRPELGLCVRDFAFQFESRGDGRTLEGYAAVFNTPTRIRDLQGDFEETILPGAFKRSLSERMPILQWDHGKDPRVGTVPIGAIQNLAEDSKGLHVRARLFDNDVVEPVRQAIEARAVRGMSFRFGVPEGGDEWPTRDKRNVRDLDAYELGPVAFPAYDTTSVSVRSLLAQLDPTEHRSLLRELAAELRLAAGLEDFTGRLGRGPGGGETGTEPGGYVSDIQLRQRIADNDALRLKGILK